EEAPEGVAEPRADHTEVHVPEEVDQEPRAHHETEEDLPQPRGRRHGGAAQHPGRPAGPLTPPPGSWWSAPPPPTACRWPRGRRACPARAPRGSSSPPAPPRGARAASGAPRPARC